MKTFYRSVVVGFVFALLGGSAGKVWAAVAGVRAPQVSNVTLIRPVQLGSRISSVVGEPMLTLHPLAVDQIKYVAKGLLESGPLYAVNASKGIALLPQNQSSEAKAVFVPFKNSDFFASPGKTYVETIPLAKKITGRINTLLQNGDHVSARTLLNGYFDKAWEKGKEERDWANGVRSFFEVRNLIDIESNRGVNVKKVRKVELLPAPVRAELAKSKNHVVYSYINGGKKSFAVFNSKSNPWGARGALFGPKGERLGSVKTRTELDPWEQDQVDAFQSSPEDRGFPRASRSDVNPPHYAD